MAIKNLRSIHDLVNQDDLGILAPVADMAKQTGDGNGFTITDSDLSTSFDPQPPVGSILHAGLGKNQPGISLIGPQYHYAYGGAATSVDPSIHDLNGATPGEYVNEGPQRGDDGSD